MASSFVKKSVLLTGLSSMIALLLWLSNLSPALAFSTQAKAASLSQEATELVTKPSEEGNEDYRCTPRARYSFNCGGTQINTQYNQASGNNNSSDSYWGSNQGNSGNQGYNWGYNQDNSSNSGNQMNNQGLP